MLGLDITIHPEDRNRWWKHQIGKMGSRDRNKTTGNALALDLKTALVFWRKGKLWLFYMSLQNGNKDSGRTFSVREYRFSVLIHFGNRSGLTYTGNPVHPSRLSQKSVKYYRVFCCVGPAGACTFGSHRFHWSCSCGHTYLSCDSNIDVHLENTRYIGL